MGAVRRIPGDGGAAGAHWRAQIQRTSLNGSSARPRPLSASSRAVISANSWSSSATKRQHEFERRRRGRNAMRGVSTIAMILACGACQVQPAGTQVAQLPGQAPQAQAEAVCHDFKTPVTAEGKPAQASGQACEQPDGRWQVVQNTPGLPTQGYTLEPPGQAPAAAAASPQPPSNQPQCSTYTAPVTVGGQARQA